MAVPESPQGLTRRRVLGLGLASGLALTSLGSAPFWFAGEHEVLRAVLDRLFDPGDHPTPTPREVDAVQAACTYLEKLPKREQWLCRGLFRSLEWECLWTHGSLSLIHI